MRPSGFPQANTRLLAPPGMDDCEDLPVYKGGGLVVSLWRPTWRERMSILLFGRVWMQFVGVTTHPPVALIGRRGHFSKE